MIDNFLEETLATSTVVTDAAAAPCPAAPELDCEPHDAQITPAALSTTIQENPICFIPLLLGVRSEPVVPPPRMRSRGHPDQATATAFPRVVERWKIRVAEAAAWPRWRTTGLR